jgi:hypothetical protein
MSQCKKQDLQDETISQDFCADKLSGVSSCCEVATDSSFSDSESDFGPSMSMHRQKRSPLVVSSSDSEHNKDVDISSTSVQRHKRPCFVVSSSDLEHDNEDIADVGHWTETEGARNVEQFLGVIGLTCVPNNPESIPKQVTDLLGMSSFSCLDGRQNSNKYKTQNC